MTALGNRQRYLDEGLAAGLLEIDELIVAPLLSTTSSSQFRKMSPISSTARSLAHAVLAPAQYKSVGTDELTRPRLPRDDMAAPPTFTSPPPYKLTGTTKVGLAMIPVIVALVGLYILFLFWYRKRRAARNKAPPVPEKDGQSQNGSIISQRRSSKVFRMAAFVAPLHESLQRATPPPQTKVAGHKKSGSIDKSIISYPIQGPKSPSMIEAGPDSPIDGSSPFRLKRGNTVKRSSIGPELSRLWPSPPASAWMKPATEASLPAPAFRKESAIYQQPASRFSR